MGGTGRTLLTLSLSSNLFHFPLLSPATRNPLSRLAIPATRVFLGFKSISSSSAAIETDQPLNPAKHSILLEKLRLRHLKDSAKAPQTRPLLLSLAGNDGEAGSSRKPQKQSKMVSSFEELGLSEEVLGAVREMGISVPTEIQCIGVPAVLEGKSVVLGSHTGSGKTLAYMLPLVQVIPVFVLWFVSMVGLSADICIFSRIAFLNCSSAVDNHLLLDTL